MRIGFTQFRSPSRNRGFTLVEIAIALGVIAFALVAIIGVLPLGLNTQRESREQTTISSDATYWMQAVTTGAKNFQTISNYVDWDSVRVFTRRGNPAIETSYNPFQGLQNPTMSNLVGVLSLPKGHLYQNEFVDRVEVNVRPLNGPAADQVAAMRDFAFRYRVVSEVIPFTSFAPFSTNFVGSAPGSDEQYTRYERAIESLELRTNLFEFRLSFQWPVLPSGQVGNGNLVYRTLVGSRQVDGGSSTMPHRFFQPQHFVYARTNL